jgi:ADP-ribose pyrophosphatase YjhB (NUDIX family)
MNHYRFCSQCGKEAMTFKVPENDTHQRQVCNACHTIFYENPKIVVGAVTTYKDQFLLCKRAIEPQIGFWTYPAGYLENKESLEQGVLREAAEEAGIAVKLVGLVGIYSLTAVNQVHVVYAAEMIKPDFCAGDESLEVAMFAESDIPWDNLAFPVIRWALSAFIKDKFKTIDSRTSDESL